MIQAGPPPQSQHMLPFWAQVSALAISIFLALLRAAEFFRSPHLHVRLTRDLFFRLIDRGEALFCHAVVLARNGPILILDVRPKLSRISKPGTSETAEKVFPLEVAQFGEKVKGPQLVAEHHFFVAAPFFMCPTRRRTGQYSSAFRRNISRAKGGPSKHSSRTSCNLRPSTHQVRPNRSMRVLELRFYESWTS